MKSMKICQIATVGRNPEWIQLGLFRYSTNLLVLVTTEEYIDKAEEAKALVKGIETRIEVLKESRDPRKIVEFLKRLINSLYDDDYKIYMNITSGLVSWQLLFYSTATILREKVSKFYLIDKERKEPLEMVLYKPLSKPEQKVILSMPDDEISLGDITESFRAKSLDPKTGQPKGTSGLLSRYLKVLTEEGLVETVGKNKQKTFRLTEQGFLVREILS